MEDFLASCLQSGFSVAVAAYLLVRMEKRLDELTGAIRRLESAITHMEGGELSETNHQLVAAHTPL
ncbi:MULTISPECIES: YvrJ family protein [Aminobacterium]|jgi:hypothetical protein|uniref:YvrJ family protein n=1 Tax=Aminobacterium colombiense (strain DSM 12261 / ALA-1) TaxID=572547 RepID=D5EH22_AMICL|nr:MULTISPECIES: YvrJ family protein [Aminobacterium]MDD2379744.1 YvrJ family protein [Aminobacterium colombiense]ADE57854.1 hypothetical protein Amico_1740 [Aminobacterium colombiense DSM 12261]MDD3768851.1 YvrJ family protein [Aminobacterium colombiense]MDD4266193.1 YvrJ family protein [Aminobacterium colombiense]MDD4586097.1 YvrJ family protein [Aminobacterium colombiense]